MNTKKSGFVKIIILVVILLIILGVFGVDIKEIMNRPTVQSNLHETWEFVQMVWFKYLAAPFFMVWNKVVIGIIWKLLILPGIHALQSGNGTT
jgi:hypothetical protein